MTISHIASLLEIKSWSISVVIISLLICINSSAQSSPEYSVIKVVGDISYSSSGESMTTGDKFSKSEKLNFKTPSSRAAVIEGGNGKRLILSSSNNNNMTLLPAMNNISSRSGALNNLMDLQLYFTGDLLIFNKAAIEVNPKSFPLDEDHFFFMQYSYQGEAIPKRLGIDDNKMVIDKNELFKIDGKPIDQPYQTTMTLMYYDQKEKKTTEIGEVTLIFPNLEQLKMEVQVLLDALVASEQNEKKVAEIRAYLTEFYAKPESTSLNSWLSSEFGIQN